MLLHYNLSTEMRKQSRQSSAKGQEEADREALNSAQLRSLRQKSLRELKANIKAAEHEHVRAPPRTSGGKARYCRAAGSGPRLKLEKLEPVSITTRAVDG